MEKQTKLRESTFLSTAWPYEAAIKYIGRTKSAVGTVFSLLQRDDSRKWVIKTVNAPINQLAFASVSQTKCPRQNKLRPFTS